jgi:hypothetical protein
VSSGRGLCDRPMSLWVTVDRGRGLCSAAHFRFAPEAEFELEYCYLPRWATSGRMQRNNQCEGFVHAAGFDVIANPVTSDALCFCGNVQTKLVSFEMVDRCDR